MDDHFDIGRVFEIGKFDITRLTCRLLVCLTSFTVFSGDIKKSKKKSSENDKKKKKL